MNPSRVDIHANQVIHLEIEVGVVVLHEKSLGVGMYCLVGTLAKTLCSTSLESHVFDLVEAGIHFGRKKKKKKHVALVARYSGHSFSHTSKREQVLVVRCGPGRNSTSLGSYRIASMRAFVSSIFKTT